MAVSENDRTPTTMEPSSALDGDELKEPQRPIATSLYDKLPELRRLDQMVERAVTAVKLSYGSEPARATIHHALDDLLRQTILEEVTLSNGVRLYRLAEQSEAAQ